ncbi:unnamed protein product [Prunus armeniaca]
MPAPGLLRTRHPHQKVPPLPCRQAIRLHPPPLIGAVRPRHTIQMGKLLIARLSFTSFAPGRNRSPPRPSAPNASTATEARA